jgi:hypothetical protein
VQKSFKNVENPVMKMLQDFFIFCFSICRKECIFNKEAINKDCFKSGEFKMSKTMLQKYRENCLTPRDQECLNVYREQLESSKVAMNRQKLIELCMDHPFTYNQFREAQELVFSEMLYDIALFTSTSLNAGDVKNAEKLVQGILACFGLEDEYRLDIVKKDDSRLDSVEKDDSKRIHNNLHSWHGR